VRGVTGHLITARSDFHPGVRILSVEEFKIALDRLQRAKRSEASQKPGTRAARTRVAKALLANADELHTAATTSLLLIENRIEVLQQERPNSDSSIALRDNEITALTRLKGQLEIIRGAPERLQKGEIRENEANKLIKSFSEGVREYWNANSEVICGKTVNIALFASTVLVCKLAGASGDLTIAVSAAMAGGKTVMDGLKGIMRKVFK
jgi:hypothetical protein